MSATREPATVLAARDLVFGYEPDVPVLRGVSVQLTAGELLVVLGPNGAGKSTLLRCLAGLARPWSGSVQLAGDPLAELAPRERARRMAVVPQGLQRVPQVTVDDFVTAGRYAHLPPFARRTQADRAAVRRAIEQVDLAGRERASLTALSGGQLQRALVARALAQEPDVLLVDEPTNSLDLSHQLDVFELIAGLTCTGHGVLVVTHDLNLASQFGTRLLLMNDGAASAEGAPSEVLRPEVLVPVYGKRLQFGQLPAPHGEGTRPWVLPWGH
ncbi:ABC transporter ATP-binding protein [Engelhardtia mirabilis]|uniref:ABC transporter ATP-binding protein n=1 Tax=Engelhardtia mirabilis TaxID=2528011 RepID=UPI003AF3E7E7